MNKIIQSIASLFGSKSDVQSYTARSPATWFPEGMFGRRESASGVHVTDAVAMSLSAYYCGLNMIAGTVASLPLNVYKRDGKMRDVWPDHPAHYLLHTEPNPEMTAMSFRQAMLVNAIHRGNGYAEIIWDSRGNAFELWPLSANICTPRRDDSGQLWYQVQPWAGELRYLKPENVLHIPGLGFDGLMGYGLMQVARDSMGLNAGQDQYAAKFFRNGGNISGTIESPKVLDDKKFERLKSEIANKLQGLSNAHRVAILEDGMKFNAMNPTHEEAQLIESRRFSVEEWARWLNMPPHKLKEMTHATFSNIEHQNIEWVVDSIRPWLVRFEQEYDRKLIRKRGVFYTKHVVEGLLRGDLKSRYDAYAIARSWGWFSANDILELEDRNPLPGDQGDMYLVPMNMTPADMVGQPPPTAPTLPPETTPADETPAQKMMRTTAERIVRLELKALERQGSEAYVDVADKIQQWLGATAETAGLYCGMAKRLNLVAMEKNIGQEEIFKRKVSLLIGLTTGDKHVEIAQGTA